MRRRGGEEPPRWAEWLGANFQGSQRTANDYMFLAKNRRQFEHELHSPNVSIRQLLRIIRPLGEEEREGGDLAGGGEPATG